MTKKELENKISDLIRAGGELEKEKDGLIAHIRYLENNIKLFEGEIERKDREFRQMELLVIELSKKIVGVK